ncbi:MAG: ATP-dependent helicase [Pirellulales bacterium]|nr:ATP-dependent helicase [Pirellulales bacterium]
MPLESTGVANPNQTSVSGESGSDIPQSGKSPTDATDCLKGLNSQQREAVTHGDSPLLIIAGAGTGKTTTLAHRVAWLVSQGADPSRILLLTFTRRSAAEMIRRAETALSSGTAAKTASTPSNVSHPSRLGTIWGGTFHAVATRLLRMFAKTMEIAPDFTILDRSDSEDLMNVLRTETKVASSKKRFPKKGTCVDIYSRCVNAQEPLKQVLKERFPWCKEWREELGTLFSAYVDRKETDATFDYDDLLLYWQAMLEDEAVAQSVRKRFDYVLVDEYQDTNPLQAAIVRGLCPEGKGLTVVGDDAQSIYSFRAATVRNILDFPSQFPNTTLVRLEQNYRSTSPILTATNEVIRLSTEQFEKELFSAREVGEQPEFARCEDESDQADLVIERILSRREAGIDLPEQAVLFRASHHSMALEAELNRRNIPYRKYGGLKFTETSHVKDLLAFLRLAENPRDISAGLRILCLLPGVGAKTAYALMELATQAPGFGAWKDWKPPKATAAVWTSFRELMEFLAAGDCSLSAQIGRIREFFTPILAEKYDNAEPRKRDLEQLEALSVRYETRQELLAEMALDPPQWTGDFAGPPVLDDDYLILSTIHSAKGLEWRAVYLINASDGNIPSDMATKSAEEIDEELRLFYVALTRAKDHLAVCCPLRYYLHPGGKSDVHGYAQITRFLPKNVLRHFQQTVSGRAAPSNGPHPHLKSRRIRSKAKQLWE